MEIEGTYTLEATPREVWSRLTDKQLWGHAVSGFEQVEVLGRPGRSDGNARSYRVTIRLNQAQLTGRYLTRAVMTEQHAPYYCRIALEDEPDAKTLHGYGVLHLNQQDDQTIVAYKGNIVVENETASPVVMKGAVKLLLQQFFTTLSERVYEAQQAYSTSTESFPFTSSTTFVAGEQVITIPAPERTRRGRQRDEESPRLRWVLHLLRIGGGDPEEELRWTLRIRRYGVASVLLFLVWVGTRIPRRRRD
jgi:carbon monoxide dehydrogenase subunit G